MKRIYAPGENLEGHFSEIVDRLNGLHWSFGAGDVVEISLHPWPKGGSDPRKLVGNFVAKRTSCEPQTFSWHAREVKSGKWAVVLHGRSAVVNPISEDLL